MPKRKIEKWYRLFVNKSDGRLVVIDMKLNWFTHEPKVDEVDFIRQYLEDTALRDDVGCIVALPVYDCPDPTIM